MDELDPSPPLRPQPRPDDLAPGPLRPAARPDALGATSARVAAFATREGALPPGGLALIGLFYAPEGASALLRQPDGTLLRVVAGGLVDGGRVSAILRDGVRLQRDGREEVLTLPA